MRFVSIGDLVLDYYFKNSILLGVDGGISVHNIVANLSHKGMKTSAIGACGDDKKGDLCIRSLKDLKVDTSLIKKYPQVKTRSIYISFIDDSFTSKRKCPICEKKEWYDEQLIDKKYVLDNISKDDILIFASINETNKDILSSCQNKAVIDLGHKNEFEKYSDEYIIDFFKRRFEIININEKVYNYFKDRFNDKKLFNSKLIIITRGKKGADFIYNNKIIKKKLTPTKEIDSNGAGDAFFSSIIYDYFTDNFSIDSAFNNATKLTSTVVSSLGARGHLHNIYKVDKIDNNCICTDFKIKRGE